MAKDGFKLVVNGETVFETDDKALSVSVRAEQGELASFGVMDIHELHVDVSKETFFNKHLNEVERENRQARIEAVRAEETSEETEETESNDDGSSFAFGSEDGTPEPTGEGEETNS